MRYIPHTAHEVDAMLEAIGLESLDALFTTIPEAIQLKRPLDIPPAMPEPDLLRHLQSLAQRNTGLNASLSFLGGGTYHHAVPAVVSQLLLRGELYTAYTPYQPEISQGTLQIIFEFQTLISELLGVEVANASMYDGSTALAEAALMALRIKRGRRSRILVPRNIHPEWYQVLETFVGHAGGELIPMPVTADGLLDLQAAEEALQTPSAALIMGYPTFFGTLDDLSAGRALCDAHDALLIATFQDATAFGLLQPPGAFDPDIVCGEGQALGVPASFGGPHLGLMGCKQKYVRQLPGRLAGQTVDVHGERGFVLTLATREQHIRREKATSNICTNVALMATAATIAMSLWGPQGLEEIALASHLRSEALKQKLSALDGFGLFFDASPTYHEWVLRTPKPAAHYVDTLASRGIAPGIALSPYQRELGGPDFTHALLVTATEMTSAEAIDTLAEALSQA